MDVGIGETRLTRNEDGSTLRCCRITDHKYNAGVDGGRTQRIGMLAWRGKGGSTLPRGVAACACVVNAAAAATIIQVVSNSAKTDERRNESSRQYLQIWFIK